jgi:ribosomal protein L40E
MSEASQQQEQSVSLPADERRIARGVAIGLPSASVAVAVVVGLVLGVPMAVLVLAAGALLGVIALLWASLRVLSGDAPLPPELEALDAAAHGVDALAGRKKMLLRAIKDLDNERALGKLEDEDYEQVASSYRNDLKDVMRKIDASLEPFRAKAEEALRAHMDALDGGEDDDDDEAEKVKPSARARTKSKTKARVKAKSKPSSGAAVQASKDEDTDTDTATDKDEDEDGAVANADAVAARVVCARCEASNEPDAKFCKGCGATLGKQEDADDEA